MDLPKNTPPTKPHFFKPLINPNFHNELMIPSAFFIKYLNNERRNGKKAMLRTNQGNRLWEVKVKGRKMIDGWKEFVKHHDLHFGDFLVFGYEGNSLFHVLIFDPTACEREYPTFDSIEDHDEAASVEEVQQSDFQVFKSGNDNEDSRVIERRENKRRRFEANETSLCNGNPYFVATLKPSYAKQLMIPTNFSNQTGLCGKICQDIVIRDQKQRLWNVEMRKMRGCDIFFFRNGWHAFCVGNYLKEGDTFMFELTEMGNKPTLKFHRLGGKAMIIPEMTSNTNPASTPTKNSYFCGVIRPTNFIMMRIPRNFAKSHDLENKRCDIILKNQNGASWQVKSRYKKSDGTVYISDGWRVFAHENGLKVGGRFKLELVKGGKTLLMNYYEMLGNHSSSENVDVKL